MTIELEQEFFKVFGIEPTVYSTWDSKETQIKNFNSYEVYPEVTDHRLLQMICLLAQYRMNEAEFYKIKTSSIVMLKNYVLGDCIDILRYLSYKEDFKHQIQQLFKEGE